MNIPNAKFDRRKVGFETSPVFFAITHVREEQGATRTPFRQLTAVRNEYSKALLAAPGAGRGRFCDYERETSDADLSSRGLYEAARNYAMEFRVTGRHAAVAIGGYFYR